MKRFVPYGPFLLSKLSDISPLPLRMNVSFDMLQEIPKGEKRVSSVKEEEDIGRFNDVPNRSNLFDFQP